ncbi:MAG: asparagine synthetase B family protein [Gemmatimonadota bacterium]
MNVFLCGLRLDGGTISKRELFPYLARLPKSPEWDSCGNGAFAGLAMSRAHAMRPLVARFRGMNGVGDVRLDNRHEVATLGGVSCEPDLADLALVLAALDRKGADIIPRLRGDFSFVAWDAHAQKIIAARDAFGIKPLFYRRTAEHLLLSSRLEPLAGNEEIDPDYVADFLIGLPGAGPRTIWKGALEVQPGGVLVQRGSVTTQSRYWSAHRFEPAATVNEEQAVERFRELFFDAVRQRVTAGQSWAQLSGGLDSSSVVSAAERLREIEGSGGLNGTVTLVDSLGNGDERRFSDTVVQRYGLVNEVVRDYWPWRSECGRLPVATDVPSPLFPFYARDQHMLDIVTHGGGRVLLSGLGSDHYMYGTLAYLADMFARGSVRAGAREVLGWALQTRRSVWHTARLNVVNPLLFNLGRRNAIEVPRWLNGSFAHRTNVIDRLRDARSPRARLGRFFPTHSAVELARVASWVQRGLFEDRVEVRYPFLARDLVEFTLQLPVSMKIRPQGRKWVLREAMRGTLPEEVRTRVAKGGIDARILWTLQHERSLIDALLTDSQLERLGCIDPIELHKTIDSARHGVWKNTVHLLSVLALESWLRARSGDWPLEYAATQTAA